MCIRDSNNNGGSNNSGNNNTGNNGGSSNSGSHNNGSTSGSHSQSVQTGDNANAVSYTHLDVYKRQTQNNPFGWTCPGWSFDWGWSPAAVPWILQNCWEYYEFTGDVS